MPIILLFFFASCVEDVDFEQAEDIAISPVVESSLIFFDFPASQFSESTGEIAISSACSKSTSSTQEAKKNSRIMGM
ncbi:MAG: hypothetical protein AAF617_13815, partial [Bacteroidota bacterium]